MPELKFNKSIYNKEAIKQAVSAYSAHAKFTLTSDKEHIKVRISRADPLVKNIIGDEFGNYVLGVTKKCL
jgi:hypothetical protein